MNKDSKHENDIEKSWLVRGAVYDDGDIPFIDTAVDIPTSLIPFSQRNVTFNFSQWIHFYEPDSKFVQLWNNPKKYLPELQKFDGVISPDFSICPDDPFYLQGNNKYINHAIAYWLSTKGIPVIPNVRWGDERSYKFCFNGIEKNSVVAVGSHGQLKKTNDKKVFLEGLPVMVSTLTPHTIIVYGKAPDDIFKTYRDKGINIIRFASATEQYYSRKAVA